MTRTHRLALALLLLPLVAAPVAPDPATAQADDVGGAGAPGATSGEFAVSPLREPAPERDLRAVLADAATGRLLRVLLRDGSQVDGFPWGVVGDTLRLLRPAVPGAESTAATAERVAPTIALPLPAIAAAWQQRPGTREGLRWGAKSGAIVMGGLGLLVGAVVVAFGGEDSDLWPVALFGGVGALAGAGAGSIVGGVAGSLTLDWLPLWPPGLDEGPAEGGDGRVQHTHWNLEPGWASHPEAETGGSGPGLRVAVLRRLGRGVELGPCLEYHDVGGTAWNEAYYGGAYLSATSSVLALGLDVHANDSAPGLRPLASAGLGWAIRDGVYLEAHLGAGLRWRNARGTEWSLIGRRFLALSGDDPDFGRFWTLSAGVAF